VIGSAGSKEKVDWLVNNTSVDYAFNYKELRDENISTELRKAHLQSSSEEEGIDLYFDNVGGKHLEAALDNTKTFFWLCILDSSYTLFDSIAPGVFFRICVGCNSNKQ
jgi:NADPH-dependent curcumin reductase CurA